MRHCFLSSELHASKHSSTIKNEITRLLFHLSVTYIRTIINLNDERPAFKNYGPFPPFSLFLSVWFHASFFNSSTGSGEILWTNIVPEAERGSHLNGHGRANKRENPGRISPIYRGSANIRNCSYIVDRAQYGKEMLLQLQKFCILPESVEART